MDIDRLNEMLDYIERFEEAPETEVVVFSEDLGREVERSDIDDLQAELAELEAQRDEADQKVRALSSAIEQASYFFHVDEADLATVNRYETVWVMGQKKRDAWAERARLMGENVTTYRTQVALYERDLEWNAWRDENGYRSAALPVFLPKRVRIAA